MDIQVLPKGGTVNIKAKAPTLTKLHVGTGWDMKEGVGEFDLDLSAFLLNAAGKIVDSGLVYYGEKDYKDAVHHTGDNRTGAGEGDDEVIEVTLANIPAEVTRIPFLVNIYEGGKGGQNFGQVKNAFVRLVNAETKEEFARHDLASEYPTNTGVLVGELYRDGDAWAFKATAEGVNGEIKEILQAKGME